LIRVESNSNPENTFVLVENQFSDLSKDEFIDLYLMKNLAEMTLNNKPNYVHLPTDKLVGNADWRGKAVTPVKN